MVQESLSRTRLTPLKGVHFAITLLDQLTRDAGQITVVLSQSGRGCYGEDEDYAALLRRFASTFPHLRLDDYIGNTYTL